VDPQRSSSADGEHGWFEGGEWDRGRHGPRDASYRGAEEEYTGDVYGHGPSGEPASDPAEPGRRTTEAIDVGALRRPTAGSPPPEYPLPSAEYPPAAEYAPQAAYPPPPAYGGPPEQPLYPASPPAAGNPVPATNPAANSFGASTAAVHTLPPRAGGPSIYQSRKPVVMIILAVLTVLFEIPALRLLGSAMVADNVPANGVVAGTFLVIGIPVFAYGVYGMLGGAPVNANVATWVKQPLIYVPLGVLLFLFAALAA
jgi:hypothetical protein